MPCSMKMECSVKGRCRVSNVIGRAQQTFRVDFCLQSRDSCDAQIQRLENAANNNRADPATFKGSDTRSDMLESERRAFKLSGTAKMMYMCDLECEVWTPCPMKKALPSDHRAKINNILTLNVVPKQVQTFNVLFKATISLLLPLSVHFWSKFHSPKRSQQDARHLQTHEPPRDRKELT